MSLDYKEKEICSEYPTQTTIDKLGSGISINNGIHILKLLQHFIDSGEKPNDSQLKFLFTYCNNTKSDEIGAFFYLFILSFNNDDLEFSFKIANELISMCELPSFQPNVFLNIENINLLINHIQTRNVLFRPAFIFLQQLLYKSELRQIFKETNFLTIFESLSTEEIKNIIYSFFSHTDEIDSSMYESLSSYVYQSIEIENDDHKSYRFLFMLLRLLENGFNVENIDLIIEHYCSNQNDFMIEITTNLILYSQNFGMYFDYVANNLYQYSSIKAIFKISLVVLSKYWTHYSFEEKQRISTVIADLYPNLSFSHRYHLVDFLCSVQDWNVFNSIPYFVEMLNLVTHNDLCLSILVALTSFLANELLDDRLKFDCICLFPRYSADFDELIDSPNNEISEMAQLFANLVKDFESEIE